MTACWLQISEVRGSNPSSSTMNRKKETNMKQHKTRRKKRNRQKHKKTQERKMKKQNRRKNRDERKPEETSMKEAWKQDRSWNQKFKKRPRDGATQYFFSFQKHYRGRHLYFLKAGFMLVHQSSSKQAGKTSRKRAFLQVSRFKLKPAFGDLTTNMKRAFANQIYCSF